MSYIDYIFQIFQDYSRLLWQGPKLLSVKNSNFKFCIWTLAISDPSRVLCMGSKFQLHEPIVGCVWDSGLDYVRKTLIMTHNCYEVYFGSWNCDTIHISTY